MNTRLVVWLLAATVLGGCIQDEPTADASDVADSPDATPVPGANETSNETIETEPLMVSSIDWAASGPEPKGFHFILGATADHDCEYTYSYSTDVDDHSGAIVRINQLGGGSIRTGAGVQDYDVDVPAGTGGSGFGDYLRHDVFEGLAFFEDASEYGDWSMEFSIDCAKSFEIIQMQSTQTLAIDHDQDMDSTARASAAYANAVVEGDSSYDATSNVTLWFEIPHAGQGELELIQPDGSETFTWNDFLAFGEVHTRTGPPGQWLLKLDMTSYGASPFWAVFAESFQDDDFLLES